MSTLFISDLHLDPQRPAVTRALFDLLRGDARRADALYILGDFFEVWVGDDDDAELGRTVKAELHALTRAGVPVYLMHGNRDFLLGQQFCRDTGCELLPDPSVVRLYGKPVLLMHGDRLCTDDVKYQQFRAECRSEDWQRAVLSRPLQERRMLAEQLRQDSRQATSNKAEDIMDVNPQAVHDALHENDCDLLIHGHTHRPNIHHFEADGKPMTRIVLGDWERYSWVLTYRPDHTYSLDKQVIAA